MSLRLELEYEAWVLRSCWRLLLVLGVIPCRLVMRTAEPISGLDQTAITLCALTTTCHLTDITECSAMDRSVSSSTS